MELKHIKELMTAMSRTGTKRLKLKEADFELTLERSDSEGSSARFSDPLFSISEESVPSRLSQLSDYSLVKNYETSSAKLHPSTSPLITENKQPENTGIFITSPMVGTFYTSPSPADPSFIKPGDKVEKQTIVCIIEAMKVMNEIKANATGSIAEILVENGQPVEFGTKLFRIIES